MTKSVKRFIALIMGLMVFVSSITVSFADTTIKVGITRVSGNDRYQTALKVADALKKQLDVKRFESVIVTTGENWADALAGSSLAASKMAPILLVKKGDNTAVFDYIRKNLIPNGSIYILGGTKAVSGSIQTSLRALGNVKRLGGETKYDTNMKILGELEMPQDPLKFSIVICSGNSYADAISSSAMGHPIMLVSGDRLSDAQKKYLTENAPLARYLYIIGGPLAVSEAIEKEISSYKTPIRIQGTNKYATSVEVAKKVNRTSKEVVMATGENFPDGLAGGVLAYAKGAPLLLTSNTVKFHTAYKYLARNAAVVSGTILGGKLVAADDATGLTANGKKKAGLLEICGRYYFAKDDFTLEKNVFKTVNGNRYYFTTKTGVAAKDEMFKVGSKYYGAQANSQLAKEGWVKTGKLRYYFKNYEINDVCIKAKAVLDKKGYTLKAAYEWSAALKFVRFKNSPLWGSLYFANIGFSKKYGDCNVMAATFFIMAKMLGYEGKQVKGTVNIWNLPHSWVYLVHNGEEWLYDPNCLNEVGSYTFKVKENRGTAWTYHKKYIVMPLEWSL